MRACRRDVSRRAPSRLATTMARVVSTTMVRLITAIAPTSPLSFRSKISTDRTFVSDVNSTAAADSSRITATKMKHQVAIAADEVAGHVRCTDEEPLARRIVRARRPVRAAAQARLHERVIGPVRREDAAAVDERVALGCDVDGLRHERVAARVRLRRRGGLTRLLRHGLLVDADQGFDYPATFVIDHPDISQVVSFTATYNGQAMAGEMIAVPLRLVADW